MQGSQRSGKTWKTWKRGSFKKKSGKTWKSQGIFVKFLKSQGKVREFFSRMPWIWCFLANLWISIFKFFSCRTQPWWVLQIIMIITKINTLDFCKTDRGVLEERDYFFPTSWKNCRFWSGKKGVFSSWVREKLPFFSTFIREKGCIFHQKSGKIILGNCWEPWRWCFCSWAQFS